MPGALALYKCKEVVQWQGEKEELVRSLQEAKRGGIMYLPNN